MQDDLSNLKIESLAGKVVRVYDEFVSTLNERAGENEAAKVILDDWTLDGRVIEQKPERFLEDELVEPVLEALGYEPRFRPKGFDGLEGRIPDFTVTGIETTVIGEVKVPGKISDARRESFEYLQMATARLLVGIATDGFVWILHGAGSEGEQPIYRYHVPLHRLIRNLRKEKTQSQASRQSRRTLREGASKFVREFHQGAVSEEFSRSDGS